MVSAGESSLCPLSPRVTSGKLFNFSVSYFRLCRMGSTTSQGCDED